MSWNWWKSWAPSPGRAGRVRAGLALPALLALAALAWPGPPGARMAHAQDPAPLTLLVLGDSLAAGFGLRPAESFPALLEERLRAEGYPVRVINAGVSGDTSAAGLSRLPWLLKENPDLALVELGANDSLQGLPPARLAANLDAILARLAERGIPTLLAGMKALANFGPDYARDFDAAYVSVAKKHGATLVPFLLEGVALRPELNQADGIHPNPAGARKVADTLYPALRALVRQALAKRSP